MLGDGAHGVTRPTIAGWRCVRQESLELHWEKITKVTIIPEISVSIFGRRAEGVRSAQALIGHVWMALAVGFRVSSWHRGSSQDLQCDFSWMQRRDVNRTIGGDTFRFSFGALGLIYPLRKNYG
jgi:hypothetical protein